MISLLLALGAGLVLYSQRNRRSELYRQALPVMPGMVRVVVLAHSPDGGDWTLDPTTVVGPADVPDLLELDGTRLLYAMDSRADRLVVHDLDQGARLPLDLGAACDPDQDGHCVDPAALRLPDGRVRLYFTASQGLGDPAQADTGTEIRSALSTDGRRFTLEDGARLATPGLVDPDPVLLADGRVRLYHSRLPPDGGPPQVLSAISDDAGLTFRSEPGIRLRDASASRSLLLPDGRSFHAFHGMDSRIHFAVSGDGLALTRVPGAGLGPDLDDDARLLGAEAPGLLRTDAGWVMAVATTREPLWPINDLLAWGVMRDAVRAGIQPPPPP